MNIAGQIAIVAAIDFGMASRLAALGIVARARIPRVTPTASPVRAQRPAPSRS
jgi:hypothetical protein